MSLWRRAAKVDSTQAAIVEALRKAGYVVEIIRKPVDLAVRHPRWPVNTWKLAEAKTEEGVKTKRIYDRAKMKKQKEYCEKHSIPRWTSPEQALQEVEL